jgi:predicted ATPase/DNA-binding winged helix-turn-helix (wHTH) protein
MTGSYDGAVSFGPFQLAPLTRKLQRHGVTLTLGDRALDILIVLVEHAGKIVSHRDLNTRVWRDLVVTPGNLRVHMAALRKALGDGDDGARYIANVAGQGYTFVAPVQRLSMTNALQPAPPVSITPKARVLPPALARMVGRDDAVRTIAADLRTDRFVTIVGPGGMGKTTVAVSVAHAMLEQFAGNVCFIDLGAVADPKLLAATIASTLGLSIQSADPTVALMTFLRTERMLLLLDNCEHVIDAAAPLAEMIFAQAPEVHILATSREAMRVEGEHAHRLRPLESPPPDIAVNAAKALTFPAVKLFVDRATASDSRFAMTDANASIVVDICGRLDGVALALEFVAGRIGTYGLEGTATLLDKRLGLHWQGRRTALPRHQTLHALLDWSYGLLSPSEQQVLRRLSIFVGTFSLDAAQAVASDAALDEGRIVSEVDQLISKSLVSVIPTPEGSACYRLLETTRVYALGRLEEFACEAAATAERHARYFTRLLNPTSGGDCRRTRHEHLGNVRGALEWCFAGSDESHKIEPGIDLAAASVASFLDLSLWNECRRWSEAALAAMPGTRRGDRRELVLQEALAISSLLTNVIEARTAIDRGLDIARQLGETAIRFRLLGALHVYVLRMTDFKSSLSVAEEMDAVARASNDVNRRVIADWMLGSSQYVLGNPAVSKQLFENGFSHGIRATDSDQQLAGLYYRTRALYGLARVQWLCGFPDRALQSARQSMVEAAESGSPVNVSYSLVYSCYVFLWCGDLDTAQEMNEQVMTLPHWQGRLVWFHAEAFALKGELLVRRGRLHEGIELLRNTLADMQASSQKNLMLSVTACCLAEALATVGRPEEALAVINDAIAHAPGGAETWDAPELFRIKALVLMAMPAPNATRAENCLMQSLALARHQGAMGWELRTTITLARLRSTQGRAGEARDMLSKLYDRFSEGFHTQDLQAAAELLTSLSLSSAGAPGSCPR